MFLPKSETVARDIKCGIDLEVEHPFFNSVAEAENFYLKGVSSLLPKFGPTIRFSDFGGGQGLLAHTIRDKLLKHSQTVKAQVVDANPSFLKDAESKNLNVKLENIEVVKLPRQDLITMRLVNHYNCLEVQKQIFKNIYASLQGGGAFVMQMETGNYQACKLRTEIAGVLETYFPETSNCWITLKLAIELLERIGFQSISVTNEEQTFDINISTLLDNAWKRNLSCTRSEVEFKRFLEDSGSLIIESLTSDLEGDAVIEKEGVFYIRSCYPIISAVRRN